MLDAGKAFAETLMWCLSSLAGEWFWRATAGAYVISALYYLITQMDWTAGGHTVLFLKPQWDGLLKTTWWPVARHDIRDVYEGASRPCS